MSQPFIVARMITLLRVRPGQRVLDVGTGSGYQAAVLAGMGCEVFGIEIVPALAEHARRVLAEQGYGRVDLRLGDGAGGRPEAAPFDAVIVACAPFAVPSALVGQLRDGGRLVMPVGVGIQQLVVTEKKGGDTTIVRDLPVRFVPMVDDGGRHL